MADGWKSLDYLNILKAIDELPFSVGRKLLIEFLQGKTEHESIKRNRLDRLVRFGCLGYESDEIGEMIDQLVKHSMIQLSNVQGNAYWKTLELTAKGRSEIDAPTLNTKADAFSIASTKTIITENDKLLFSALGNELSNFNDEQKKAIVSNSEKILCIAGAGSGKTTVLTKRIEFLMKYRSLSPDKILAITFTRKARQEMEKRLISYPEVRVETFNSFCEKLLQQHNNILYQGQMTVVSYKDKRIMMNKALFSLNIDISRAVEIYFSQSQKRGKTDEQLGNIFLNDCFFVLDYFKFKNKSMDGSSFLVTDPDSKKGAELIEKVCRFIDKYMKKHLLRDYADQLLDVIRLFKSRPDLIPKFDQILVDEYQDVNSTQIELIDYLNPRNLFCVGDPRQSIYGWRGSDLKYILNFKQKYQDAEVVMLTKNYRSCMHIVKLINRSIDSMKLPDLEHSCEHKKDIHLVKFDSEDSEREFIVQNILASDLKRSEIFILARTNRQLNEISLVLAAREIKHIVRSEERLASTAILSKEDEVTLSTVHAIKGLEAEKVFIVGCNSINFPCKSTEHPAMEMVKLDEYDKEEEERRLLYVAMSRARKSLIITYTGSKPSYFITSPMLAMLNHHEINFGLGEKSSAESQNRNSPEKRLREWRREISAIEGIPPYMIMNDKTLIEIIQKMPSEVSDLHDIYGLGPTKIRRYGKEIIESLNN